MPPHFVRITFFTYFCTMALEIEHKYLVVGDCYRHMASERKDILQGYLCRTPERTVRVRTIGKKGFLTVKGKNDGDTRLEFEYEIPYDDAVKLLDMCEPGIIDKTRFLVSFKGMVWEVDEFHGSRKGLVVAEVEIPYSGYEYEKPPFVGENVTGNPDYYNSNLG